MAALCVSIFLSACSNLGGWQYPWARPSVTPSHRFPLPPERTDVIGEIQVTTSRHEDTLLDIARRYDLGYEEIVAANPGVDPWLPGEGTEVVLPTQFVLPTGAREGLVINLPAMRLFYYPEPAPGQAAEVITHPVGIGREGWLTPQGNMHITHKMVKPAWTVPESVRREYAEKGDPLPKIVPPGPDNPLGDFAMRLSRPTYLIHGTNQPYGVGLRVSHGCVRLYPEDIARLFPEVAVGTVVRIVNEPYLAGWRNGELYLEAHQPLSEDAERWKGGPHPMEGAVAAQMTPAAEVSWDRARAIAREARGLPLPIAPGSPELDELLAKARRVPSLPPWALEHDTTDAATEDTPGTEQRVGRAAPLPSS
ncbi:MAG: L,D-transpeptidase family protein [Gammaproteobacteria bacterium]|jgi:L,D-transpeptidase ErfK/SrfK